ncbi:hypothetical protein VE04_01214 [Pseudogymnoascus sp. 24MN13]|nr:hypothetical protein VE04_01214 [Pseudogymnoascus sp. 24MN13]
MNTTSSNSTQTTGWTSSPDGRGTNEIILTCLFTIVLCCWTSVCPNLPALSDGRWAQVRDKLDLTCIGLLGPEFLLMVAVGQRSSARRSVKKFREAGFARWTLAHAFLADMGGFVLEAEDLYQPIPVDAEQLFYLIERKHVDYPVLTKEEIDDKSKTDTVARFLTIGQAMWFVAAFISRPIQGLSVTTLELTTISFIIVFFATSYSYQRTPLDFIDPSPYVIGLLWRYYVHLLHTLHIPLMSRPMTSRPQTRIRGGNFVMTELDHELVAAVLIAGFSSAFMGAWDFHFPTVAERNLWRCASVYTLAFGLVGSVYVWIWHRWLPPQRVEELEMGQVGLPGQLGKTDLVVEVLKHLPYIRTDGDRGWRLGYDDTKPITYVKVPGTTTEEGSGGCKLAGLEDGVDHAVLWDMGLEPHGQKLDSHVVALTNGWQYGAWLLLDTEAGTITDFSLLGGISSSIRCPQSDRDAGLVWKHFPSKPIKEFFKDWEKKYTSLEWIPIQDKNGRETGEIFSQKRVGTASKDIAEIQRIFMDYGWGSTDFRKEECRKALSEWGKARGQRIVAEHDKLVRANRSPSPPDPLDEFSD